MQQGFAGFIFFLLFVLAPAIWLSRRQRRKRVWGASCSLTSSPCDVDLLGGPRGGKTLVLPGMPAPGAHVDDGVVADYYNGVYVAQPAGPHPNRIVALWEPKDE